MQVCADPSDPATLERERRRLEVVTPTRAEVPADAKAEHFRRCHGTVALDPTRVGRDASRIADEVIAPLAGQLGAVVKVTLEIDATLPAGLSDHIVRTVTEKFATAIHHTIRHRNAGARPFTPPPSATAFLDKSARRTRPWHRHSDSQL